MALSRTVSNSLVSVSLLHVSSPSSGSSHVCGVFVYVADAPQPHTPMLSVQHRHTPHAAPPAAVDTRWHGRLVDLQMDELMRALLPQEGVTLTGNIAYTHHLIFPHPMDFPTYKTIWNGIVVAFFVQESTVTMTQVKKIIHPDSCNMFPFSRIHK